MIAPRQFASLGLGTLSKSSAYYRTGSGSDWILALNGILQVFVATKNSIAELNASIWSLPRSLQNRKR
jgi:hypothetical protein